MTNYPDKWDRELIHACAQLKSEKEIESFLRDILTLAEIKEASKRFQIAKSLWTTKHPYLQIAEEFQTSTTTVTRVADWLWHQGKNGYQTILKRLYPEQK